jgi:hypothetical protein
MMSETAIQTAVCGECGADVRDGSLFCYSCGKPVPAVAAAEKPALVDVGGTEAESDLAKRPALVDVGGTHAESELAKRPASKPPLRSAASLRKQRRAFNRQPLEVVWEPRTNPPIAFAITTITLFFAALLFLILALYLR